MNHKTKLSLANPRGFCAGVDRAIEIVNRALDMFGSPIYVKHEVVHNEAVVSDLKKRGAIFIEEISDVPVLMGSQARLKNLLKLEISSFLMQLVRL